jgi:L-ascorbate metabolism protein UlaG (beta-lactamase superfamily)
MQEGVMAGCTASTSISILRAALAASLLAVAALAGRSAGAQTPAVKPEMRESCPGLIAQNRSPAPLPSYSAMPPGLRPAAFAPAALQVNRSPLPATLPAALAPSEARITYVGHATFLIESPKLVRIATDYNDYVTVPRLPDIITMNHAHPTHYTDRPDPDIKFVLRGWRNDGKPANIDLTYGDVHVRSVSTNIRTPSGGTEFNGNSIFIFEVGSLCIAHLGHLHHTLTQQQLDAIGHIDILLVPVDGSYTMDMAGMAEVVQAIKAPLNVPMHFFSAFTLRQFLDRVRQKYDIEFSDTPSFVASKATLPDRPKFLVLPGQ